MPATSTLGRVTSRCHRSVELGSNGAIAYQLRGDDGTAPQRRATLRARHTRDRGPQRRDASAAKAAEAVAGHLQRRAESVVDKVVELIAHTAFVATLNPFDIPEPQRMIGRVTVGVDDHRVTLPKLEFERATAPT
jgi:hypothetical protein